MVGMIRSCLPKLSSCLPNGTLVGGLGHPAMAQKKSSMEQDCIVVVDLAFMINLNKTYEIATTKDFMKHAIHLYLMFPRIKRRR